MKLQELSGNPQNPRKISPKKLEMLRKSITEFGSLDGFIFNNRLDRLIGGHQRQDLFKDAMITITRRHDAPTGTGTTAEGYVEINGERFPYREVDWDDAKDKAANIAANKGAGEWDLSQLSEWLLELDHLNFDLDLTMFDAEEREKIIVPIEHVPPEGDQEHVPAPPKEATSRPGDIWALGDHRLLCGDSTNFSEVERLLDGVHPDLVFTDPPYRMQAEGGSSQPVGKSARKLGERIKHLCDFDPEAFLNTLAGVFASGKMNAYVFCNKDLVPDYLNWAIEAGYSFNILFWKKPNAIPLGGSHRPDVEYLLLFRKGAIWNNGLKEVSYSRCPEYGRELSEDHPTLKPVDLIVNELLISSNHASPVLDLFGGSGSTMIACEKIRRRCFMVELDPIYCDVIVRRWEKYTGAKAEFISSAC